MAVLCLPREAKWWYVGDTLGGGGRLRCDASGTTSPPSTGWMFHKGGSEWSGDDPSLVLCPPPSPCTSITVTLRGEAARVRGDCEGVYTRLEGVYSRGRPVSDWGVCTVTL